MMVEVLASLSQLHRVIDAESLALEAQLGVPICIPNCGRCCETVLAHRIEADFAISAVIGEGEFHEMVSRCEGWLLERHKVAQIYEGPPVGIVQAQIAEEWHKLVHIPCIFLESDKSCLIYGGRPLVCRAFGVTHAPGPTADFCPRPLGVGENQRCRGYMDNQKLEQVVKTFLAGLADKEWATSGWLPAIIYREACPDKYKALVADNKVASAKIIGVTQEYGLLWQDQLEAIWQRQREVVASVS